MRSNYHYYAPKPNNTSWLKWALLRVFLPPILLWDIAKWAVNGLLGKYVGWLLLPASLNFKDQVIDENLIEHQLKKNGLCRKHYTVITHDGAELDTLVISPSPSSPLSEKESIEHEKNKKYIIYFPGNSENAMDFYVTSRLTEDAKSLNCTVIGFNYRGVHRSKKPPTSTQDLVTDGIAQVQRLLLNGVKPENIVLKGNSIGGGIATLVAKHFHDQDKKIKLFNIKSFSSLTNVAIGHIRNFFDSEIPVIGTLGRGMGFLLGWISKPIVKFLLTLTKWEIDAGAAYKVLPKTHKEYIFLRNKTGKTEKTKSDKVITHHGSLHNDLWLSRQMRKLKFSFAGDDTSRTARELYKKECNRRKMVDYDHNKYIGSLWNKDGESGLELFYDFVNKDNPRLKSRSR